MRCSPPPRRAGFTMIELLVVIAIILVLAGLLLGAIFKVQSRAYELKNKSEIALLDTAINNFMAEWQTNYPPPSQIYLSGSGNYPNTPLGQQSQAYIAKMFPRINYSLGMDWSGTGSVGQDFVLQGPDALVFFLGGIPTMNNPPSCRGFSTNPANPTSFVSGGGVKAPMFEFDAKRLVRSKTNSASGFLNYLDTYGKRNPTNASQWTGQPYAYFCSGPVYNGYVQTATAPGSFYDCATLGVRPYIQTQAGGSSGMIFWKPNSFQIISAGADGVFGPGGVLWGPGFPVKNLGTSATGGADDQSNFSDRVMSKP
jgi:prepilin-type N-terminal cleavage/methylation domain-containing protein